MLAEYVETLPGCRSLPYLPDVARLEWLRQLTILAPDCARVHPKQFAEAIRGAGDSLRIVLHPSLHWLDSRYPVLTIWHYALHPVEEKLTLSTTGENVVLWREDGEVAMAAPDPASFACISALAQGSSLGEARRLAASADPDFDLEACLGSLGGHNLIGGLRPYASSRTLPLIC